MDQKMTAAYELASSALPTGSEAWEALEELWAAVEDAEDGVERLIDENDDLSNDLAAANAALDDLEDDALRSDENVRALVVALHEEAHGDERTAFRFCRHQTCRDLLEEIGEPHIPTAVAG